MWCIHCSMVSLRTTSPFLFFSTGELLQDHGDAGTGWVTVWDSPVHLNFTVHCQCMGRHLTQGRPHVSRGGGQRAKETKARATRRH